MTTLPTANWIDACALPGTMRVLQTVDDVSVQLPIPFAMRFWGATIAAGSPINVCSNGWIGMGGMPNNSLSGMIPSPTTPDLVGPHFGDLYTRTTGVCVASTGAAPSRAFVVEWDDVHYCCTDDPTVHLTFEVVLHESSGEIDFVYQTMGGERPEAVGIQNATGSSVTLACPGRCTQAAGTTLRFVPGA
jgi:hypothetical protein